MPELVEHLEIAARDRGLVGIGHTLPALGPRAIDERMVVGDAERFGMVAVLRLDVPELDVAVEPPAHRYEPVAVLHRAAGIGDENAHSREGARENESLQRLEKVV